MVSRTFVGCACRAVDACRAMGQEMILLPCATRQILPDFLSPAMTVEKRSLRYLASVPGRSSNTSPSACICVHLCLICDEIFPCFLPGERPWPIGKWLAFHASGWSRRHRITFKSLGRNCVSMIVARSTSPVMAPIDFCNAIIRCSPSRWKSPWPQYGRPAVFTVVR